MDSPFVPGLRLEYLAQGVPDGLGQARWIRCTRANSSRTSAALPGVLPPVLRVASIRNTRETAKLTDRNV